MQPGEVIQPYPTHDVPWRSHGMVLERKPSDEEAQRLVDVWASNEGMEVHPNPPRVSQFPDGRWKIVVLARPLVAARSDG